MFPYTIGAALSPQTEHGSDLAPIPQTPRGRGHTIHDQLWPAVGGKLSIRNFFGWGVALGLHSGSILGLAMTPALSFVMTRASMVRASAQDPPSQALARLHSSVSVKPNLMIVQDAFRTRLALLQGAVPFDVAGARQLLAAAIR